MMKNETTLMTAPSTVRYYVGDLCYVMHEAWNEVCDLTFPPGNSSEQEEGELELADGRKFIIYSTAYGDGVYNDQNGNRYSVDSGTIGAIRVDDIRDPEFARTIENGHGHIHEFPAEIDEMDCYSEDGEISFYSVKIDTAGDYNDYDDEGEDLNEDDD